MKALLFTDTKCLRFCEQPAPTATDHEIVRVIAAGICGSDMHAYLGHDPRRPPPLILGHEAAGTLEDGSSVIVNPLVVCNQCDKCRSGIANLCRHREIISMPPRHGAFAEQLAIPRQNILPLPPTLSWQQGALAEPLACGHHAAALAERHSCRPLGDCVAAVIGGGAIGLAAALSLAARGAAKIWLAESNDKRRQALTHSGDFNIVAPTALPPEADVIIDAVGLAATRQQSCAMAVPGGVIVHIGLGSAADGMDARRLTLQEIIFIGSYTYTPQDFVDTVAWMSSGKLGALDWFETRPLSDGAEAFADLLAGSVAAPKIILIP